MASVSPAISRTGRFLGTGVTVVNKTDSKLLPSRSLHLIEEIEKKETSKESNKIFTDK